MRTKTLEAIERFRSGTYQMRGQNGQTVREVENVRADVDLSSDQCSDQSSDRGGGGQKSGQKRSGTQPVATAAHFEISDHLTALTAKSEEVCAGNPDLADGISASAGSPLPHMGVSGELVIPFACEEGFRWWEARSDEDMRARFRAAREAAGLV